LREMQAETYGAKKSTRRPRYQNWPLYLRALDAHDADASLPRMASVFWPEDYNSGGKREKTHQSARDVLEAAIEVRDNFPV
jgi:hypothetical protein